MYHEATSWTRQTPLPRERRLNKSSSPPSIMNKTKEIYSYFVFSFSFKIPLKILLFSYSNINISQQTQILISPPNFKTLNLRYPLVCRVLHPRNLVKKIPNPTKKITGSGRCPSLTGNKLLRFQTETCYHRFLGTLTDYLTIHKVFGCLGARIY